MEQEIQLNTHNKQEYPPMRIIESDIALNDLLQKVPMTAEILLYKQQNLNINIQWIDWSIEMLRAGYETENLCILAGEDIHCNPFEFIALTDKIFEELHLDNIILDRILILYSMYIIKQALQSPNKENIVKVLFKLEQLCVENDYNSTLYDFYLLSSAKEELEEFNMQWYWNDKFLTKENWYEYSVNYLEQWMNDPFQENELTKRPYINERVTTLNPPRMNMFKKLISYFCKK